jgi:hypothetical protein
MPALLTRTSSSGTAATADAIDSASVTSSKRTSAELSGNLCAAGRVASADQNRPPLVGQLTGDLQADPASGVRDQSAGGAHDPTAASRHDRTGARPGRTRRQRPAASWMGNAQWRIYAGREVESTTVVTSPVSTS